MIDNRQWTAQQLFEMYGITPDAAAERLAQAASKYDLSAYTLSQWVYMIYDSSIPYGLNRLELIAEAVESSTVADLLGLQMTTTFEELVNSENAG